LLPERQDDAMPKYSTVNAIMSFRHQLRLFFFLVCLVNIFDHSAPACH